MPLAGTVAVIGFLGIALVDSLLTEWFVHDLNQRGERVVATLQEPLSQARGPGDPVLPRALEEQARRDGWAYVLAVCDADGRWIYSTATLPPGLACDHAQSGLRKVSDGARHLSFLPLGADTRALVALVQDADFIARRSADLRDELAALLVLMSVLITLIAALVEALVVNPYHVEETADALHRALTIPEEERRLRMRSLRATVREFNVYRWAGRMLMDAARVRERERLAERIDEQRALVVAQ